MELSSLNVSCEPMDIDLSSNSIKNMDISHCDSDEPEMISRSTSPCESTLEKIIKKECTIENNSPVPSCNIGTQGFQNVKKYHIIMQPKKQEGSSLLIKLSFVLVLFVSALIYHVNTFTCIEDLDVAHLKNTLKSKLYGQDKAIDLLTRSLDVKVSSKLLFLYGGTGVGKTYATNLMFENVWNSSNVYHYLMPAFKDTFPNDLLLGMSFCKSSMLVVDDLSRNDFIKEHISNVIEKSEYLKKNITIILIYNSDNIERSFMKNSNTAFFEYEIREAYSDIVTYKEFIKFEPLTEEHLKLCIKKELGDSNVANMNQFMKNFNVTQDGCKGVYTKMKLLNFM